MASHFASLAASAARAADMCAAETTVARWSPHDPYIGQQEQCRICQQRFDSGVMVRVITAPKRPCLHTFHAACLERNMTDKCSAGFSIASCPTCSITELRRRESEEEDSSDVTEMDLDNDGSQNEEMMTDPPSSPPELRQLERLLKDQFLCSPGSPAPARSRSRSRDPAWPKAVSFDQQASAARPAHLTDSQMRSEPSRLPAFTQFNSWWDNVVAAASRPPVDSPNIRRDLCVFVKSDILGGTATLKANTADTVASLCLKIRQHPRCTLRDGGRDRLSCNGTLLAVPECSLAYYGVQNDLTIFHSFSCV